MGGIENLLKPAVIITAVVVAALLLACIVTMLKIAAKKKGICLVASLVVMTGGFFLLSTSTSIYVNLIGILPVILGNSIVYIMFGATIKDFIPEGKAGLFQGIRMIFAILIPMVVGPVIGDAACQHAARTIINEANAEVIVPAKNMFLWAGIVCVLGLIPLYFLLRKGFEINENNEQNNENISEVKI